MSRFHLRLRMWTPFMPPPDTLSGMYSPTGELDAEASGMLGYEIGRELVLRARLMLAARLACRPRHDHYGTGDRGDMITDHEHLIHTAARLTRRIQAAANARIAEAESRGNWPEAAFWRNYWIGASSMIF